MTETMSAALPTWHDIPLLPKLGSRAVNLQEFMDDPACCRDTLLRTIEQFKQVNVLTGAYRPVMRRTFLNDMLKDPAREYHLVDLGAGGCDADVWLLNQAKRLGLSLRITAIDSHPDIVEWATDKCGAVDGLTIVCGDMFDLDSFGDIDYAFSNHVLHHLDQESIVRFLDHLHAHVGRLYVMSDIHRSYAAYWSFRLLAGLLFKKSFVLADGCFSIRRSFKPSELAELVSLSHARRSARVKRQFPWRLGLVGHGQAMQKGYQS
jgi:2-polyprenyl-3-methyl-5-hydroxy-6-metoxy-1,4-benzoquinol methylase